MDWQEKTILEKYGNCHELPVIISPSTIRLLQGFELQGKEVV
jgi:hypothetical protein